MTPCKNSVSEEPLAFPSSSLYLRRAPGSASVSYMALDPTLERWGSLPSGAKGLRSDNVPVLRRHRQAESRAKRTVADMPRKRGQIPPYESPEQTPDPLPRAPRPPRPPDPVLYMARSAAIVLLFTRRPGRDAPVQYTGGHSL